MYDIDTHDKDGELRLRNVSKECLNWGHRVQNSVFECEVNASQLRDLEVKLCKIIDNNKDSIRMYNLGNNYKTRLISLSNNDCIEQQYII